MIARVETADGVYVVDLAAEAIVDFEAGASVERATPIEVPLPLVVAAASSGSTVMAVVDRRPPLVVSYDAGRTWSEAGGGLPAGRTIAIADDDPDLAVYAARNRLFVSRDGGRFWRALVLELPEILAVAIASREA